MIIMNKINLVENINIRIGLEDMQVLRKQASQRRMPVSTLCREKITKDLINLVRREYFNH